MTDGRAAAPLRGGVRAPQVMINLHGVDSVSVRVWPVKCKTTHALRLCGLYQPEVDPGLRRRLPEARSHCTLDVPCLLVVALLEARGLIVATQRLCGFILEKVDRLDDEQEKQNHSQNDQR